MKASTHRRRPASLCLVALIAALSVTACSRQTSPNPPASPPVGAPTSSVGAQTPTGTETGTAPSSPHQGTVQPDTYTAIVAALKTEGFALRDETGLLMRYGADQEHVTVSGTMTRQEGGKAKGYSVVEMELQNGQWMVISAR